MTFGLRGTFFHPFVDEFFPGFSKLHSKCSKEKNEENYYFLKKCNFLLLFSEFEKNSFGQLLKFVRPCCQTRILRVPRNTLYLFENFVFFVTCFNVDQKKFGLLSENIRPGCPNCSLCFHRNNSKKNIFLTKKLHVFLNILEIERKIFSILSKTSSLGLSKLNSTCPWNFLEQKKSFWKKDNKQNVFVYRAKKISLFRNNFCGVAKTALYVSIETFRRKNTFPKKFLSFFIPSNLKWGFFGLISRKHEWRCQNHNSRVCGTSVEKGIFWQKYCLFNTIESESKIFLTFCYLTFWGVFKAAFFVFIWTSRRKTFFWKTF